MSLCTVPSNVQNLLLTVIKGLCIVRLDGYYCCISVYQFSGLTYNQMAVLSSSTVFIYPEMLPEGRFIYYDNTEKQSRVLFSTAEDT